MSRVKILQISSACNCGSPGKIAEQIGLLAQKKWDVYIAHGSRHSNPTRLNSIELATPFQERIHALYSLLLDRHGLGPEKKTLELVEWIRTNKPQVIHLHNIHGYFINYKTLFEYLVTTDIPVVWTLHDCWPFTGHCAYFDSVDCMRWRTGCFDCPLQHEYPKSLFFDNSKRNFELKKKLFSNLKRCIMIPVSNWLSDITKDSYMGKYPIHVIHNGIDINTFKPIQTDLRKRLRIGEDKIVVLGVAAPWLPRKGFDDMVRLSMFDDIQIVMVGVSEKQQKCLPSNIIAITRTENQKELVEYYNMSDVFVNPTYSDNFPTTNIEALACGTPVITYRTGGSPEAIDSSTGIVLEQGDINGIIRSIRYLKSFPQISIACRERAEMYFDMNKCFSEYIKIYSKLIDG